MAIKIDIKEIRAAAKEVCGDSIEVKQIFEVRFLEHLADLECFCKRKGMGLPPVEVVLFTFQAAFSKARETYLGSFMALFKTLKAEREL
jgi:hypothetical protein